MRPSRLLSTLAITAAVVFGAVFASVAAPAMHLGAFAAAAAKPSPSPSANARAAKAQARCDAFVNDLAGKLKTSSANLKAQVKAAIDDQVDQAVKDKTLTQAQADAIKKKVAAAQGCQGLPSLTGPRAGHRGPGMEALKDVVGAAASALNLTPAALQADIMAGKTLQSVAPAGMTQAAFDAAFRAELKKALDPKVTAKSITADQETREIEESVKIADKLWSAPLMPGGFAGKRGFGHPGPGGPPGAPAGAAPAIQ